LLGVSRVFSCDLFFETWLACSKKKKKGFSTQLSIILVLEIGQAYDTLYAITDDTSFILIF